MALHTTIAGRQLGTTEPPNPTTNVVVVLGLMGLIGLTFYVVKRRG